MLAKATEHYALGRQKQAASLLSEVIRRTPNHPDAYRLMGLLNEDANNKRRALAFFMLEAHLTKKAPNPLPPLQPSLSPPPRSAALFPCLHTVCPSGECLLCPPPPSGCRAVAQSREVVCGAWASAAGGVLPVEGDAEG